MTVFSKVFDLSSQNDHLLLEAVEELSEWLAQKFNDHQRERFVVLDQRDQGPHHGVLLLADGAELGRFLNLIDVLDFKQRLICQWWHHKDTTLLATVPS